MGAEDTDSRLRTIEQTLAAYKAQGEHHEKTLDNIQNELAEFIQLARQCDMITETDKKVIALHLRVDRLAQEYAVLHSQHEACMKTGDKDSATLASIQKDIITLTLKFDQFNGMRAIVETNKMDIEALKTSVAGLNTTKDKTEKFLTGRVAGLFDAGLKLLIAAMVGWYVYSNGVRTQEAPKVTSIPAAQVQVHNNPGSIGPDDEHDNPYKKELEAHQKADRLFQQELIIKLRDKGIAIPTVNTP
jgi:hypothetical protein